MAAVRRSNFDWNGQPYWGLVQQNGPWASTPGDIKRANEKDNGVIGGGIGVGGRKHAGHANFAAIINPYQINATGPPPAPSGYARPTVMMGSVDMKRNTKTGRVKTGVKLGSRLPTLATQKMGGIKEEIFVNEPGEIVPPIIVEGTSRFGTTHHIMEMPSLIAESDISMDSTPAYINELAGNLRTVVNAAGYGDTDSHVTGYTNMFGNFRDKISLSTPASTRSTPTSLGSIASPIADPILSYYPIEQITPEPETDDFPTEYQTPNIVDSQMIPNLNMSKQFLANIAEYEKTKSAEMQKKRDTQRTESPVPVPKGAKKTALDGTFLAEEANKGLKSGPSKPMSEKAKGKRAASPQAGPIPVSPKTPEPANPMPAKSKGKGAKPSSSTNGPSTINPTKKTGGVAKKTKVNQAVATPGKVKTYLKRMGDRIKQKYDEATPDSENFLVIDAAYKLYLKNLKDKKKKK